MNNILFSEGGQPVYLDDLKALQDNPKERWEQFFRMISGGRDEAYLERYIEFLEMDDFEGKQGRWFFISDGVLVTAEGHFPFEQQFIEVPEGETLYICLKRDKNDLRVFDDGESRHCTEVPRAFLTTERQEQDCYDFDSLSSFRGAFYSWVNSRDDANVNEHRYLGEHSYTCIISIRPTISGSGKYFSLNWYSEADSFDGVFLDEERKALLLITIPEQNVLGFLGCKRTPPFTNKGISYFLTIEAGSGNCRLHRSDGDVININEISPKNFPVKLSFMQEQLIDYEPE